MTPNSRKQRAAGPLDEPPFSLSLRNIFWQSDGSISEHLLSRKLKSIYHHIVSPIDIWIDRKHKNLITETFYSEIIIMESSLPRYVTVTLGVVVVIVGLSVLYFSSVPVKRTTGMMLKAEKKSSSDFVLSSSGLTYKKGSYVLPDEYTCWGGENGDSIPLEWSGAPDGTESFMLILTTPQTDTNCPRFDWVVYDIDADTTSIDKGGSEDVGTIGRTWPGISNGADHSYYVKVPCPEVDDEDSKGETFTYTYTLYALNGKMKPIVEAMLEVVRI